MNNLDDKINADGCEDYSFYVEAHKSKQTASNIEDRKFSLSELMEFGVWLTGFSKSTVEAKFARWNNEVKLK